MRKPFFNRLMELGRSDAGQAYVEYVVIGALAVLVILGSLQIFFNAISTLFVRIAQMLATVF